MDLTECIVPLKSAETPYKPYDALLQILKKTVVCFRKPSLIGLKIEIENGFIFLKLAKTLYLSLIHKSLVNKAKLYSKKSHQLDHQVSYKLYSDASIIRKIKLKI